MERPLSPRYAYRGAAVLKKGRRRRTLPPGPPGSTIRAVGLNCRVRDGNGCIPHATATDHLHRNRCPGTYRNRLSISGRSHYWRERTSGRCSSHSCAVVSTLVHILNETGEGAGQASRGISTARLNVSPRVHLPPINVMVSHAPSGALRPGSVHLRVGFPLRCFQRLSRPDVATRRCRWRDNRYTSGRSVPVLSY